MKRSIPVLILAGIAIVVIVAIALVGASPEDKRPTARSGPTTVGDARGEFTLTDPPRPVPPFTFSDGAGRTASLADFRGRIVLVNLWATWCVPCIREMPSLDRLQAKLGGPDFLVLALSQDRQGVAKVAPFFDKLGIKHLGTWLDPKSAAMAALDASVLPTTVLIDRSGREIGRLMGEAAWDSPDMIAFLQSRIGGDSSHGAVIKTGN